jgi:hypothetical protein
MNSHTHAYVSVRQRGGRVEDYYDIHAFIDSTKEICSDNRHRLFHTHWAVKHLVVPIFGASITNSDGRRIDVPELCERDHLLPDFHNRFIPTLSDFVAAFDVSAIDGWKEKVNGLHADYAHDAAASRLLLSPLATTGRLESLLITHNSWFLNEVLPQVLPRHPKLRPFDLAPSDLFDSMRFELWMNNGAATPPSARRIEERRRLSVAGAVRTGTSPPVEGPGRSNRVVAAADFPEPHALGAETTR